MFGNYVRSMPKLGGYIKDARDKKRAPPQPRHSRSTTGSGKVDASTRCQRCEGFGHFTYNCPSKAAPYKSRPSRTQQLLNPDKKKKGREDGPSVEVPEEFLSKKGVADKVLERKERERKLLEETSERKDDLDSSSVSSVSSSDSDSDSDSDSGSSVSSSSGSSRSQSRSHFRSRARSVHSPSSVRSPRPRHRGRSRSPSRSPSPQPRYGDERRRRRSTSEEDRYGDRYGKRQRKRSESADSRVYRRERY